MQLPGAAQGVNRSGRTFKVSHFIHPVTLPFHLCYAKGRDNCRRFSGTTEANYNYQGAMCFWPALPLKKKHEHKDRRQPGYSSQNHRLSKAVWLFSRTGAKDHSGGHDKSTWALPWTHLWPCFNQRHCIKILLALTPVPIATCLPLQCWQARMASGYRRWQHMKNQTQWDTSLGYSWFITFSLVIAASHCFIETTVTTAILHKALYYLKNFIFHVRLYLI